MREKGIAQIAFIVAIFIILGMIVGGSFYARTLFNKKSLVTENTPTSQPQQQVAMPSPVSTSFPSPLQTSFPKNVQEVLLVTGVIDKSNRVNFDKFDRLKSGQPDESRKGDSTIRLVDNKDQTVSEIYFQTDFRMLTDPPSSLDSAPFAFAITFPLSAMKLKFIRSNQILEEVFISTTLLETAIQSLPDSAFKQNSKTERKLLLDKVNQYDKALKSDDFQAAEIVLNNLKKSFSDVLLDNYQTKSPLEYTKTGALELVNELIQRLKVNS